MYGTHEKIMADLAVCKRLVDDIVSERDNLKLATSGLLRMIDGLPWHTRDAVYREFNERTGGLPGSVPAPIVAARLALSN